MVRVSIIPAKPDFTDATVTIRNVNLPLLEKQRKAYNHFTPGNSSYKDEIDGLENFLNEICDTWYHQKDNPQPATCNAQPESLFFLFGNDACRVYSEDGLEALAEYIESGEGYELYEYTGDAIELMCNYTGWNDYSILSAEEYQTLSEF